MSTVKLLKDDGKDKAGAIVSRPFVTAKHLVADGKAEYPPTVGPKGGTGTPPKPVVPMVPKADLDAAEKLIKEQEAALDKLDIENKKLAKELADEKAKQPKGKDEKGKDEKK